VTTIRPNRRSPCILVGEEDINLEHDSQFHNLSHQWNQSFERVLREGSTSAKPTDLHKVNVLSCVCLVSPVSSSFCSLVLMYLQRSVITSRRRLRLFFRTSKRFRSVCSFSLTWQRRFVRVWRSPRPVVGRVLVIFSVSHRVHRNSLRSFVASKRNSQRNLFPASTLTRRSK
jgi:hypothetical protein